VLDTTIRKQTQITYISVFWAKACFLLHKTSRQ
jgi:hypothetical protein